MSQPSLNGPCPCGSGKKYKRCCASSGRPGQPVQSAVAPEWRQLAERAFLHQNRGELEQAALLYDRALKLQPSEPALLAMRGMVSYGLGLLDEAQDLLERAATLNPKDSRVQNFLGQVLIIQGDDIGAEQAFGKAVTLASDFAEAWCNLGLIQQKCHRLDEAVGSFEQALKLQPRDADAWLRLAHTEYLRRNVPAAWDALRHAESIGDFPGRVALWKCLVLRDQDKMDEALSLEAQTLKTLSPNGEAYPVLVELGNVKSLVGDFDGAEFWLKKAIAMKPEEASAYVALANARRFKDGDRPLVESMEAVLATREPDERRGLEFALGKVYTDMGEYDLSFRHYRAGNDLVRSLVPCNSASLVAETSQLVRQFSKERVASLPAGSSSDVPILIVGTPRSGTTLTEQIVSSHSQVSGAGELVYWSRMAKLIMPGFPGSYTAETAAQMAEGYLSYLRQHASEAARITDKMPGNFHHLGLIHSVFPNAKIIHCRRNPIDACLSIYFQDFLDAHRYKWDLECLVVYYEQYLRLMDHWRQVLPPGAIYDLQYESLVEDVEGESKKLMDFLGLGWEPNVLAFYSQDRAVHTASKWQARQPIYKTSRERWRRYESHLGPLLGLLKYAQP